MAWFIDQWLCTQQAAQQAAHETRYSQPCPTASAHGGGCAAASCCVLPRWRRIILSRPRTRSRVWGVATELNPETGVELYFRGLTTTGVLFMNADSKVTGAMILASARDSGRLRPYLQPRPRPRPRPRQHTVGGGGGTGGGGGGGASGAQPHGGSDALGEVCCESTRGPHIGAPNAGGGRRGSVRRRRRRRHGRRGWGVSRRRRTTPSFGWARWHPWF